MYLSWDRIRIAEEEDLLQVRPLVVTSTACRYSTGSCPLKKSATCSRVDDVPHWTWTYKRASCSTGMTSSTPTDTEMSKLRKGPVANGS